MDRHRIANGSARCQSVQIPRARSQPFKLAAFQMLSKTPPPLDASMTS
jgi:hypothetical protein